MDEQPRFSISWCPLFEGLHPATDPCRGSSGFCLRPRKLILGISMKLVGVGGFRENSNTKHPIKLYLRDEKLLLYFDRIIFIKIHIMSSHESLVSVSALLGLAPMCCAVSRRVLPLLSPPHKCPGPWCLKVCQDFGCFQHLKEDRYLSFNSLPQNSFYLGQRKSKFNFKKLGHRTTYPQNKILKHCK